MVGFKDKDKKRKKSYGKKATASLLQQLDDQRKDIPIDVPFRV